MLLCFLMWQLIIVAIAEFKESSENYMRYEPPNTLTLKSNYHDIPRTLTLTRVQRSLANEFLPVWITTNNLDREFSRLNLRDHLGEFVFYHDLCTRSAFVYFPRRGKLDGIVDFTHVIKELPIDEAEDVQVVRPRYVQRMYDSEGRPRVIRSLNTTGISRFRRHLKQSAYPELLVTINHDAFIAIERNTTLSLGMATVSHVLTVYNAVDMLYSYISLSNIQLNIAAIVIEGVPRQWNFESEAMPFSPSNIYMNASSMHPKISKYFWLKETRFPRHSFDYIVYHTKSALKSKTGVRIVGQSNSFGGQGFVFPPRYHKNRLTVVVRDSAAPEVYVTIAHELAHLFEVQHDGEGQHGHLFDEKSCSGSLMAPVAKCLKHCSIWTPQSDFEIAYHLRMPPFCNLRNYPRSLSYPRPTFVARARSQCFCYGFDSFPKFTGSIGEDECRLPLICILRATNKFVEAPLPVDGTPCGTQKVCWNGKCVPY